MSGGGGETNTVSEFKPPDYTQQYWQDYINNAAGLTSGDMPRYQGQTVAPMNQQQMTAANMLQNLAVNGTATGNAANTQIYNTAMGGYDDPYATTLNPYASSSAYMDNVVNRSNQKIADAYSRGTAAQLDRAHALSRTFGSSGQQEAQAANEQGLADALANNTNQLMNQDWYNQQNLAENQLNRASGALQQERNRQMQAAGMGFNQQNADLQAIQALMGGGDAQRNYQQDILNAGASDWWNWAQSPYVNLDTMGSALTRASGGAGTTSQQIMGGMNPLQSLLGLGLLGGSMYGAFK